MEERYTCKNCGGNMLFDAAAQALKCSNCQTVVPIEPKKELIIEHCLTLEAKEKIRATAKDSHTMVCKGCGAKIEVDANSTATQCPYCGSRYVLAEKQEDVIVPDGVIPFQLHQQQVQDIFRQWIKSRWLAPGVLKNLYQTDTVQGIYLPFWTFDANAEASYRGQGGKHRVRTVTNSEGKRVTQHYTQWYPVSGHISHFFDDVLVPATSLSLPGLEKIAAFNTEKVVSYAPEYLSGYNSECFSVDLDDAHRTACRKMITELEAYARQDILRRYDEAAGVSVSARFREEHFKHVLVPIYSTAYMFHDKVYQVLINGQTGDITGKYPFSPVKIALICAGIAAIIILISWFVFS